MTVRRGRGRPRDLWGGTASTPASPSSLSESPRRAHRPVEPTKGPDMHRICTWCGTSFTAPTSRALYCSGAHRAAASKARAAGLPGSLPSVEVGPITTHVGEVRSALQAWLRQGGLDESHPLASAGLALAQRLDTGRDTSSALASAVGALRIVMLELEGKRQPPIDGVNLIRVRAAARRAGAMGVVDALTSDVIGQIRASEAARHA